MEDMIDCPVLCKNDCLCDLPVGIHRSLTCAAVVADEVVTSHGPIEADKENIRQEPYSLPQGFMWDTLDLSSADVVSGVLVCDTQNVNNKLLIYIVLFCFSAEGVVYVVK